MPDLSRPKRDPRIDFLRGAALLFIFVDHVPGNFLGTLTLRNFGFADAAELFVLLAGFSAMLAYGKLFDGPGARVGLQRVGARCLRIYLFQIGLLLVTLAIFQLWIDRFGLQPRTIRVMLHGVRGVGEGLVLHALPGNLNILPMYIIFLAIFPLLWFGIRRWPAVTMLASAALWLATQFDHRLNLTNWVDKQGWFFNPFAWQFLFAIGVLAANLYLAHGRSLPRKPLLLAACVLYLAFAVVAAAPWENWGLPWKPLDITPDKTNLSVLRLLNSLAFVYVLIGASWFDRLVRQPGLRFVEICGRHSLEVFSVGTLGSLVGRLLFRTFGMSWSMQFLVNGAGFACMIGLGLLLDRAHKRQGPAAALPVSVQ